jgi:hypothetical protein
LALHASYWSSSVRLDIWAVIEWCVLRLLLPFTTLFVLASALISFWIGHAAYGIIFLAVFAVLALIWAHLNRKK